MKTIKLLILVFSSIFPSPVRIFLLRMMGHKIAYSAKLGLLSIIIANKIEIGEYSKIGSLTIIKCDKSLILKDNAEISSFDLIYGEGSLIMDSATYIGPKCVLNVTRDISLGYYSGIGPGSYLYTHGVWLPYTEGYPRRFAEITLKEYVWIPAQVFVGPGVEIKENTIVASGSRIFKNIGPNIFFTDHVQEPRSINTIIKNKPKTTFLKKLLDEFLNTRNIQYSTNSVGTDHFEYILTDRNIKKFDLLPSAIDLPKELKSDTIYFLCISNEKLPQTSNVFCFDPFIATKSKNKRYLQLKSFFEREAGIRFGINAPLVRYFD